MQQEAAHLGRMLPSEDEHRSAHRRREQHTPPTHDAVVIGASAGGIEALLMLLTHLPAGLAASLFIVQHLSPSRPSQLPTILRRAARLPVQWAAENRAITPSTIYVAPPDHHLLLLKDGRLIWEQGRRNSGSDPPSMSSFAPLRTAMGLV